MVEGTVLEKNIAIHKEALVESPPVLVFVIGSAEIESLDSFIDRGITRHFNSHLTKTKYHKTQIDDVGRLVTDVCIQLQKENPAAKTSKPALVGLFCKPSGIEKPGSTSEHESHFDELRQAYAKFKLYCHKEGYHFAGTFIQPTTKAQDDRKTRPAIFNTMYRLRTKLASAGTPNRLTTGISAHNSPTFLMLGIHAAQLATPFFEPPRSGKGQVSRWYLLSVVAKWCGGDGFPQSQTMLLKSPISGNGSKNDRIASFPSDLAMEKLKDCELLKGIALQNSTIIVFRAGLPPGLSNPEAKEAIRGVGKEVKTVKQHHKQTASNGGPREGENGVTANSASPANNAIKDKAFGDEAADEAAANRNGAPGHFELREEGLAKGESSFNSEVRELEEFANRRNARLVYCTVNAKTNARLFSQTGQPLVQDESCLPDQKAITAEARRVSSIFVYPPKPAPGTSTIDWLIQKQFTEKAETNTPLLLKYHPIDQTIIDSDSVRNAIFEACWDFPAGTWSSKNLSCVALAKKANRHAMRIIQPDRNGQPSIPGLHADLKNSLYFI